MYETIKRSPILAILLLGLTLTLNNCSSIPWIGGSNDKEEDLSFDKDVPSSKSQSDDDFFADDGKSKGKDKDKDKDKKGSGFASIDQEVDSREAKADTQDLQQRQDALSTRVRDLEESLHSLQPKVEATQQKLEGGLGAVTQKSDYLEPEVKELREQIARLNDELNQLKSSKGKSYSGKRSRSLPPEYTKAYQAYLSGSYDESIVMFQNLAVKNPPKDLQDNIVYWIGANYAKMGKFDEAIKQFQTVLTKFSDGNKVHDSRYMLGYCYSKKGDKAKAIDTLEAALKRNPPKDVKQKIENQLRELQ